MQALLSLARDLPRRSLAPGEALVTDGQPVPALYVLLEGMLRVEKRGVAIATFAEPGTCVGEMSLLLGVPATADVIATEAAVVAMVEDAPAMIADESDGLAVTLARLLATRLHVMTGYLVDLKEQYRDHEGGLGMVDTVLGSLMQAPGARSELRSERDPEPEY